MKKLLCIVLTVVLLLAAFPALAGRWKCESCGSKVDDRMEQCPGCGAIRPRETATPGPTEEPTPEPEPEPTPAPWICLVCGIQNAGTRTECWQCTNPMGTTPEPTETPVPRFSRFTAGNYVTFGHYPQTESGTDNTPIEWLVLDRQGDKALLISRYGLDYQLYDTDSSGSTWEYCSLRKWLNDIFINTAFTANEQRGIRETTVDNQSGGLYLNTEGGRNTLDKVFLLSFAEAGYYFGIRSRDAIKTGTGVTPTAYAIKQSKLTNAEKNEDGEYMCHWWLRSPGAFLRFGVCVGNDGLATDFYLYSGSFVRPALWVDLDSGVF